MSAYEHEGCSSPSYGSYSGCSNCGPGGTLTGWNALDYCQTSPAKTPASLRPVYTPASRCDYQERVSRNRYDWKEAFDYGTSATNAILECPGMQCCKDYGAGQVYMGPLVPEDVGFPWGMGGKSTSAFAASYGSYVGEVDKDRCDPYGDASACETQLKQSISHVQRKGIQNEGPGCGLLYVLFTSYQEL